MKLKELLLGLLAAGLVGCSRQEPPPAKNAFTDHVDRGMATLHKAEDAAAAANARIQATNQQTQQTDQP